MMSPKIEAVNLQDNRCRPFKDAASRQAELVAARVLHLLRPGFICRIKRRRKGNL